MASNRDKLAAALASLNNKQVAVGWFEEDRYPDGQSVAQVMRRNEQGNARQPARPLMRTVYSEQEAYLRSLAPKFTRAVLEGRVSPEEPLRDVGEHLIAKISEKLQSNEFDRNAPSTIKKKGFDKPLVDTGHAGQSVQAKVT